MFRLVSAVLLAGILPFGGDDPAEPFPVEAKGDIPFHFDGCRYREGDRTESALYLSIPQTALVASPDSAGAAQLSLQVEFLDADNDPIRTAREIEWIPIRDAPTGRSALQPMHLLTLWPEIPFGTAGIRVRIEDLSGQKRGILDRIRGKKPYGEAVGRFDREPFACGFSDLTFAWDVDLSEGHSDRPARRKIRPNPLRYYGLFKTTLLAYVEIYGPAGRLGYQITQLPSGSVVTTGGDSTGTEGRAAHPWLLSLDISALPSGSYRLDLWKGEDDSCRVGGEFQVLWETTSWTRDQDTLLEEAYVLLGPSEYEEIREMSRGEAEAYLANLWREHDPNPSTGTNELREIFDERVTHANTFYGNTFRKGMLTDRGRVYVRYGPPDEIEKALNPQDRDLLSNVLPEEVATDRLDIIRKPQQYDAQDNRAYEIWFYQVRGDPLFPEQMNPVQRTGLKFIFVDELGYGDMRLVYTNIAGAF